MRRQSNSNLLAATLAIATTLAVVQGFDSATLHGPDVHAAAVAGHKTLHKHESPHSAVIAAAKRANIWSADREEKIVQPLKSFWIDTFPQLTALSKEQWRKDLGLHPLIVNELIRDGILPADKSLREKALHPHAGHGKGIPAADLDQYLHPSRESFLQVRSNDTNEDGDITETKEAAVFSMSRFMGHLLVGYDGEVRPYHGQKVVEMLCAVHVHGVTDVNQIAQTVEMVVQPDLKFTDPRLFYEISEIQSAKGNSMKFITAFPTYKGRLWEPNWLFTNSVEQRGPLRETYMIRPKGIIRLTGLYTVKFFSPFMLQKFPFDRQWFTIKLGMWDQSDEAVHMSFPTKNPITVYNGQTSLWGPTPENPYNMTTSTRHTVLGSTSIEFTTLEYKMQMKRGSITYILEFIIPINFIFIVSYLTYWVDPKGGLGRDGLSVTSYLALIVFQYVIAENMPPTAYVTWLQVYLALYGLLIVWSPCCFMIVAYISHDPGWYDKAMDDVKREMRGKGKSGSASDDKESGDTAGFITERDSLGAESEETATVRKMRAVRIDMYSRSVIPMVAVAINTIMPILLWI